MRALDRAVVADRRGHQALRVLERRPHVVERPAEVAPRSARAREQQRRDGRHRLGRVAVVRVRVALADPDRPVRRRPPRRAASTTTVVTDRPSPCDDARDDERVAQRQLERPQPERERHPAPRAARPRAAVAAAVDPGQRVDRRPRSSRHSASPPKRTGSSHGRPGLGRGRRHDPPGLGLVGDERRVERHRHDLRRRDEPRDLLVERDERRRAARSGSATSGRWSKSWSAMPGLWTMTIACGVVPWMSPSVTRAVRGVVQAPLPLDDHPVAARLALLGEPLGGALDEVGDDPVDGHAPALDHHPGLAGGHERRAAAGRGRRAAQLEGDGHLADRAVRADGQEHPLARRVPPADGVS